MEVKLKVKRFDGKKEYFEIYTVSIEDRTTILEALFHIKDYKDNTLSFRAQCRSAICGTCAVKIGDNQVLACKTKVKDFIQDNILTIEPAGNLPVIKDLVTDQAVFLDKLGDAKAWFEPKEEIEPVYPEDLKQFEKETDCILCGICYSVCPVFQTGQEFGGPINFVKIYRFWKDKNDALKDERLVIADKNKITACVHCKYCTFSCPKEIPVEQDILQLKFYGKQKGIIKEDQEGFGGFSTPFGF
ncbi:succinate dehydrogenase/fumarate reductase iron-sulfur subunit [Persephonella sp.]